MKVKPTGFAVSLDMEYEIQGLFLECQEAETEMGKTKSGKELFPVGVRVEIWSLDFYRIV